MTRGCSQNWQRKDPQRAVVSALWALCFKTPRWTKTSAVTMETQNHCYSKSAWRAIKLSYVHSISLSHAALTMQLTHPTHAWLMVKHCRASPDIPPNGSVHLSQDCFFQIIEHATSSRSQHSTVNTFKHTTKHKSASACTPKHDNDIDNDQTLV